MRYQRENFIFASLKLEIHRKAVTLRPIFLFYFDSSIGIVLCFYIANNFYTKIQYEFVSMTNFWHLTSQLCRDVLCHM